MKKLRIFIIMLLVLGATSVFVLENTDIVKASSRYDSHTTTHGASSVYSDDSSNYTQFDSFYFGASYYYQPTLNKKISVIIRRNGGLTDYWADGSTVLYTSSGTPYSSGSGHKDYPAGGTDPYNLTYDVNGLLFYVFHHSSTILETYYYGNVFDNVLSSWTINGSK